MLGFGASFAAAPAALRLGLLVAAALGAGERVARAWLIGLGYDPGVLPGVACAAEGAGVAAAEARPARAVAWGRVRGVAEDGHGVAEAYGAFGAA